MKKRFLIIALMIFVMSAMAAPSRAGIIMVTSTEDSGAGSLRQVLQDCIAGDLIQVYFPEGNSLTVNSPLVVNKMIGLQGFNNRSMIGAVNTSMDVLVVSAGGDNATLQGLTIVKGRNGITLSGVRNVGIGDCRIGMGYANENRGCSQYGISVENCDVIRIGQGGRNVIGYNNNAGIHIANSTGTLIFDSYIGVNDIGTTACWNFSGIFLEAGASSTLIGNNNVISGNTIGIRMLNCSGNTVCGNIIGMNYDGASAIRNSSSGIYGYNCGTNWIGLASGVRNLISGNGQQGISLYSCHDWVVQNNVIGPTAHNGLVGNGTMGGIILNGSFNNQIGGNRAVYEYNIISGNGSSGSGISLDSASWGNTIAGNYLGTDMTGTGSMANAFGIMCESNCNMIGGIQNGSTQYGNVISGNLIGLEFYGSASFNLVAGNYVGTSPDGNAANANSNNGIHDYATTGYGNQFGTGAADGCNVIAANAGAGLYLEANERTVIGNRFGIGTMGNYQMPNQNYGLYLRSANNHILGNLMADGIRIEANGNTLAGNLIGVMPDLSRPFTVPYVGIDCNGSNNWLGLPGGPGNLIANASYGIRLNSSGALHNGFFANTICANATSPISRVSGANQNKPASVITTALTFMVAGTAAAGDYIELFAAELRAGQGGSLRFLTAFTADGTGHWNWVPTGVAAGEYICALSTDNSNNTSLFSSNVQLLEPTPTVTTTPTITPTPTITLTATISPTPTITPTDTATATATDTSTITSTYTATATATATSTVTSTSSCTPTATHTLTATGTSTETDTPTITDTPTATGTMTETSTPTATQSSTPTVTYSPTDTETSTVTLTFSQTATPTITPTATPTPSMMISATPTATTTLSATRTITATPVISATLTATPSLTLSPTVTMTSIVVATATCTNPPTSTATPSAMQSFTPTSTVTISDLTTSISSIYAFPNPARRQIKIVIPQEMPGEARAVFYNAAGEKVADIRADVPAGGGMLTWDCSQAAGGVYLLCVKVDGSLKRTLKIAVVK